MVRDASGATRPIRELISAAGIEIDDWFLNGAAAAPSADA
jgi:hypothetical protein